MDDDFQETGAVLAGPGIEEPLMEPSLTLQQGIFNQCNCPPFSIFVCVCLPLEAEGRLLMVAVMAMVVMLVVVMMMRWQWRCSHGFWLSSPCFLKDSLRPDTHPPTSPHPDYPPTHQGRTEKIIFSVLQRGDEKARYSQQQQDWNSEERKLKAITES
ncbi:unnamed protein product [Pleuronectes platessa]|uniref:Uncharacterized protein n=1 Tax=Pleuronectes platessa TaxID=8262 RepID=A0A9N7TXX2_PLEPL|nr:unnamed protein product [Pleuronectes platessa]